MSPHTLHRKVGMAMKIEAVNMISAEPVDRGIAGEASQAIAEEINAKAKGPPRNEEDKIHRDNNNSAEEIQKNINELNSQLEDLNHSIQFSVDNETKDIVVKVVDKESGEVVRQIPPEGVMKLRESIKDMAGLIVEKKV